MRKKNTDFGDQFPPNRQQDAEEFLRITLDMIGKEAGQEDATVEKSYDSTLEAENIPGLRALLNDSSKSEMSRNYRYVRAMIRNCLNCQVVCLSISGLN